MFFKETIKAGFVDHMNHRAALQITSFFRFITHIVRYAKIKSGLPSLGPGIESGRLWHLEPAVVLCESRTFVFRETQSFPYYIAKLWNLHASATSQLQSERAGSVDASASNSDFHWLI